MKIFPKEFQTENIFINYGETLRDFNIWKTFSMKTKMTSQFVLNVIVILFAKTEICVLLLYIFRLDWNSHCVWGWCWTLNFNLHALSVGISVYHYTWESNQRFPAQQVSALPNELPHSHHVNFIWHLLENEDKIEVGLGKRDRSQFVQKCIYKATRNGEKALTRF